MWKYPFLLARVEMDLTQVEVANRCEVSPAFVHEG